MILTRIEDVKTGYILAKDIYTSNGNILLKAGRKLDYNNIKL